MVLLHEAGILMKCLLLSLRRSEANDCVSWFILRSAVRSLLTLFCKCCILWRSFNQLPSPLEKANCIVKRVISRTTAAFIIFCLSKMRLNLRCFRYVCTGNWCQNITDTVETHWGFIDLRLFTRQRSSASYMDILSKQRTACCGSFDKNGISKVQYNSLGLIIIWHGGTFH